MALLGKIELRAERDLAVGTQASILDLFPFEERSKQFAATQPVKRDETKLRVNVDKFGTVEAASDANLPAGFNTSLVGLMKWNDMAKKVTVSGPIKKGDALLVTFES